MSKSKPRPHGQQDTFGSPDDPLLAAVRDEVIQYGMRRATLSSIAQRADVSRVTVYRRVGAGGVRQLIMDALVAEFAVTIDRAAAQVRAGNGRERLVGVLVASVEALIDAPLTAALLGHDPEMLLPYLVDRHGTNQRHILDVLALGIQLGQADGSIRPGDARLLALVLLHATQDFVISARIIAAEADPATVHAELARLIDGYLKP